MPQYVYVTESTGLETGLDMVFFKPGKAINRLREYYGNPVPRGSVAKLKDGETVWSENGDGNCDGFARRMPVF